MYKYLFLVLFLLTHSVYANHSQECKTAGIRYTTQELIKKVLPSIVYIHDYQEEKTAFDELLDGKKQQGISGTGFFIQPNLIVTNRHVIDNYASHYIILYGIPKRYKVTVVASDVESDIAILQINEPDDSIGNISPLSFAEVSPCQGDNIIAIGHPTGMRWSVSRGIVSHTSRFHNPYTKTIQIDAAVNPGNSGGPLLDYAGKVVGINSLMLSGSKSNAGVNLSISSQIAVSVITQLLTAGQVYRPTLGMRFKEDFEFRGLEVLELSETSRLNGVVQVGDIISHINGQRIYSSTDLFEMLLHATPGCKWIITVDGVDKEIRFPDLLL